MFSNGLELNSSTQRSLVAYRATFKMVEKERKWLGNGKKNGWGSCVESKWREWKNLVDKWFKWLANGRYG